jgi:hypothetical protein
MGSMRARLSALAMLAVAAAAMPAGAASAAPDFTRLDSLFLAAATGEPRLQALRDSSARTLVALGDTTLEYLARARLTGQTPRQQHYVERLFTVISDSGRNAGPRRVLEKTLRVSSDTVRAQLLYIGSAIGDTAFLPVALSWLHSESPLVRRNALRSLGHYARAGNRALLEAALPGSQGLERQQVLWALEKQPGRTSPALLAPVLRDPYFFNRQKACDLLLKDADSSWAELAPLMPAALGPDERREWRLLARAAKGGEAFLRGELMTREERVFFGVGRAR